MSTNPTGEPRETVDNGDQPEKTRRVLTAEEKAAERKRKRAKREAKNKKREMEAANSSGVANSSGAAISSVAAISSGVVDSSGAANSSGMDSPSGAVNSSVAAANPLSMIHIGAVKPLGTVNLSGTADSSEPVNADISSPRTPVATPNASGKYSISSLLRSPLVVPSGSPVAVDEMARILGAEDPTNQYVSPACDELLT
jgi:hypothetical protein